MFGVEGLVMQSAKRPQTIKTSQAKLSIEQSLGFFD